jgi:F-type H+-transporting ATPase subunit alpha
VDLAQYRELEAFAAFGSDLDKASQQQLARGVRMVELLKQPASSPFPVEREVVSIWTGANGYLDPIEVSDVRRFETELHEFIANNHPQIFTNIAESGDLNEDTILALRRAVDEFTDRFEASKQQAQFDAEVPKPPAKKAPAKKAPARKVAAQEAPAENAEDALGQDMQ